MVIGKYDRCVGGKEGFDAMYRIMHSSGSVCHVHSIGRLRYDGDGVVQGADRILMEANEKICAICGYSREELLGESARIFYPGSEEYNFVGSEKYRQIADTGPRGGEGDPSERGSAPRKKHLEHNGRHALPPGGLSG
jgi:PAS domain-containing protein